MLNSNARKDETNEKYRTVGFQDLADEGASLLVAGTETTATTIAYATYYLLLHPDKRRKLLEEIATVERDDNGRLPLSKLDALPYLVSHLIRNTMRDANLFTNTERCHQRDTSLYQWCSWQTDSRCSHRWPLCAPDQQLHPRGQCCRHQP
jgi:cytochrome P450